MAEPEHDPGPLATRPGQLIIADKGYASADLDRSPADREIRLLRPHHPLKTLSAPARQETMA